MGSQRVNTTQQLNNCHSSQYPRMNFPYVSAYIMHELHNIPYRKFSLFKQLFPSLLNLIIIYTRIFFFSQYFIVSKKEHRFREHNNFKGAKTAQTNGYDFLPQFLTQPSISKGSIVPKGLYYKIVFIPVALYQIMSQDNGVLKGKSEFPTHCSITSVQWQFFFLLTIRIS